MSENHQFARRSVLMGAAGAAAVGLAGGLPDLASADVDKAAGRAPLWKQAERRGLVFGSSIATWQLDSQYRRLYDREVGLLWPEDDLLWYQLKPTPQSDLNFTTGDRIFKFARENNQLAVGGFLVWDEGFGEGWTDDDLWGLGRRKAEKLLYGVARGLVHHYRGQLKAWIVANEVTDPEGDKHGFRTNVPWYNTIGPEYIAHTFHIAEQYDPKALRVLNEFGFETTNQYGDSAVARQRATLRAIDRLLDRNVPVQALGIQAHLLADRFHARFHEERYRTFLREVADRGLKILITEMDVLDEGLPRPREVRDKAVADVYRHYLNVTLDEPKVKLINTFGLTDRYTWYDEDMPRDDGSHRRPLAFNRNMGAKASYYAISKCIRHAPKRTMLWKLKKGH